MASLSPVRGDVLERAVALRTLGKEWAHIAAELGVRVDQVSNAVRRHNLAAGASLGSECAERPAGPRPPAASSHGHETSLGHEKSSGGNYLVIPDPQIPFHKRDALQFIERVRRAFSVPKENMLCAGDECAGSASGPSRTGSPPSGDTSMQMQESPMW